MFIEYNSVENEEASFKQMINLKSIVCINQYRYKENQCRIGINCNDGVQYTFTFNNKEEMTLRYNKIKELLAKYNEIIQL